MPPWVDSIRNSRPLSADGVHPIPAFCVHPNRSPDGRSLSISGVSGSDPDGPAAWVLTFRIAASSGSKGLVATGVTVYQRLRRGPRHRPLAQLPAHAR